MTNQKLSPSNANFLVKTNEEWEKLMDYFDHFKEILWVAPSKSFHPKEINNWEDYEEETVITLRNNHLTYGCVENLAYPTLFYCEGLLLKTKN